MENQRKTTGQRGEDEACRYLQSLGHVILERNWRCSHLEIDIITLTCGELHIVEVKTRKAPVEAMPEVNVGRDKKSRLVRAAKAYLNSPEARRLPGAPEVFFDVITVVLDGDRADIEYYPQAFIPLYVQ